MGRIMIEVKIKKKYLKNIKKLQKYLLKKEKEKCLLTLQLEEKN